MLIPEWMAEADGNASADDESVDQHRLARHKCCLKDNPAISCPCQKYLAKQTNIAPFPLAVRIPKIPLITTPATKTPSPPTTMKIAGSQRRQEPGGVANLTTPPVRHWTRRAG
jgi:hypothetical protein